MEKYVNDERLQQSLAAVRDRLAIKDKTEAQALVLSSTYPNCVYYTSDTHCVVVGGIVYGDVESIGETECGEIIAEVFGEGDFSSSYEFAADTSSQANWDTSKIYYVPSSTAGMYNIYSYSNGAWSYTQSSSSPIPAANVSYDRTNTPNLGNGNVLSAVEAINTKVEDVDTEMIKYDVIDGIGVKNSWLKDSEETKILPIASGVHEYKSYKNIYASIASSLPRTTNITNSSNTPTFWNINSPQYTVTVGKYYLLIASLTIGEANDGKSGTLQLFPYKSGTNDLLGRTTSSSGGRNTVGAVVGTTYYLYQIFTPTQNTTCYSKIIAQGAGTSAQVFNFVINYLCCFECSTLAEANTLYLSRATLEQSGKDFDVDLFNPLYTEYYLKGVADGSGMASIVGLGYNIYDYITGAVNMAGFEYGCEIRRKYDKTPVANMQNAYKNNTSVVYFPKTDFSGCTLLNGTFYGASKLFIFPSIDVGTKSFSCLQCFTNATSLQYVGDFDGLTITNAEYMFQNCPALKRVGKLKFSASCSTANMFNTVSPNLTRVEELDVSAGTLLRYSNYNWNSSAKAHLRYMLIKGLGANSGQGTLKVNVNWPLWGIADAENPDARQSLVDTLLTYSFDRATAGYSTCTVTLSAATKALLTTEELEQITAKGYTIA